jgi:fumarylpyruvate hydrolase
MSAEYVVTPPPVVTLPVVGSSQKYPVRRIYCVGRNYAAHAREFGHDEKLPPFFFAKAADMIVPDGATVPYPSLTQNYHHEVELVAAIGKGGVNIPADKALEHVYGYAVGFDMTRRDVQQAAAKNGKPWEVGKSFDNSAPCGPVYPAAQVGHITSGKIEITVNGQVKQSSDINLMIWDVAHIIEHLSQQVTLEPGDLIFTGTPEGVSAVVKGDVMVGSVEKLGTLTIKVG